MRIITLITYFLLLTSCSSNECPIIEKQQIPDRTGRPLYRAALEPGWQLTSEMPNSDTTVPNAVVWVEEDLSITVYNFPQEKQIPPRAQIERWKKQLPTETETLTTPVSWSGYEGLFFEAPTVLGWAFSVGSVHYRHLTDPEKRADVTLKATGTPEAMTRHREAIEAFAHSFEMIEEIPAR